MDLRERTGHSRFMPVFCDKGFALRMVVSFDGEKGRWHRKCGQQHVMNQYAGQPRHILVVDDEPLVRYTVQLLLKDDGYIVDEAQSAAEALALFEPGKFDMVFTDYAMPEMRGDQLAAAIKRRSPGQPVVMITAFLEKLQSSDCPLGGVDSIICKPFEADTLRTAISRFTRA